MDKLISQVIVNWVIEYNPLGSKQLKEIIFEVLKKKTNYSDERIYEEAEKHEKYVYKLLSDKINENDEYGILSPFKIDGDGGSLFYTGLPFLEKPILDKIITEDPKQFEKLCRDILEKLGARSEIISGENDGGVDFIGYNLPVGAVKFKTKVANQVLVIGQAKRYSHEIITETDLRIFVGAAVKKRYDLLVEKKYDAKYIQPTVYAFWTTSDFHPDARIYAKAIGLWALNGICIARLMIELGIVQVEQ
jgi:hypothetical protein